MINEVTATKIGSRGTQGMLQLMIVNHGGFIGHKSYSALSFVEDVFVVTRWVGISLADRAETTLVLLRPAAGYCHAVGLPAGHLAMPNPW
jgi:hypothetical protein